jgi:hypothetical protein
MAAKAALVDYDNVREDDTAIRHKVAIICFQKGMSILNS